MKNRIIGAIAIVVVVGIGAYVVKILSAPTGPVACTMEAKICPDGSAVGRSGPKCEFAPCPVQTSYRSAVYDIDGTSVTLVNGVSRVVGSAGASDVVDTRVFGNEATGDLDASGTSDVAFILTQTTGGTGVFYYVAAAVKKADGYYGTNAILLGDRIAPQATSMSGGVVTVSYADRGPTDSFAIAPSVMRSLRLSVVDGRLEVLPNMSEADARVIAERTCIKGGESLASGMFNPSSRTWWYDANLNATKPGCSPACVVSESTGTAEINWRCTGLKQ